MGHLATFVLQIQPPCYTTNNIQTERPWISPEKSTWLQRMAVDPQLGLEGLKVKVAELYKFRDHFFEENSLSEARGKAGQVGERKVALLEVFREEESKIAVDERATFLYLRGRVQNISGEYSPDAEATLSKAVKLNPDLADAWNELGECYMMKQDWKTAKTCFEGALQHRKDKVSLRNLSMTLRQVGAASQEERIGDFQRPPCLFMLVTVGLQTQT